MSHQKTRAGKKKTEEVKMTRLVFAGVLSICIYTVPDSEMITAEDTVFFQLASPRHFTQILCNEFTAVRSTSVVFISELWTQTVIYCTVFTHCKNCWMQWRQFFLHYIVISAHFEPYRWYNGAEVN